jgi:hypothetical protein
MNAKFRLIPSLRSAKHLMYQQIGFWNCRRNIMTSIEEKAIIERFEAMDVEQMQVAIKAFPIQIVFNELERRENERIELLSRLDNLTAFVGGITR